MELQTKELTALCIFGSLALLAAYAIYANYYVSSSSSSNKNQGGGSSQIKTALAAREYRKFELVTKSDISHNTRLFRFALQSKTTVLGLPCGMNVSLRFFDEKSSTNEDGSPEEVRRPYTPVTSDAEIGYFDMVIKIYDSGRMTQYLDHLVIGDLVEVRGPMGRVHYLGRGEFRLKTGRQWESVHVRQIGMIAGGTGITPMLQVIRQICKDPMDDTQVSLIFGNVSMDDILLFNELKEARANHENIHVFFTVDKGPTDGREWNEGIGYVTVDMLKDKIFPPGNDTIVLNCGPPIMMKICEKNLLHLGHPKERIAKF